MLKEKRQIFEYALGFADIFVVSLAWCLAYWFWFLSGIFPITKGIPVFKEYFDIIAFILPTWIVCYSLIGLYKPMRGVQPEKEQRLIIYANTISVLCIIVFIYLFVEKEFPFSRAVLAWFWFFSIVFSLLERALLRLFLKDLRRRGFNLRYMLIIGAGEIARNLARRIRMRTELGIQLIGCLDNNNLYDSDDIKLEESFTLQSVLLDANRTITKSLPIANLKNEIQTATINDSIPVIGNYFSLKDLLQRISIDQVVVAIPIEDYAFLPQITKELSNHVVDVKIIPDLHRFISLSGSIEEFEGMPVIGVQVSPLEGLALLIKRIIDIIISLILILIFSPLLIILAVLVKITSKGDVFYYQERASLDGSIFRMYKFRTMKTEAEKNGPGWTTPNDNRVTPLGKILRKYSLDELPQLFNVFFGHMSIVGPRPERPIYIEQFRKRFPKYMLRHKVPSGITGWAQVNGWRGDTAIDTRIEYDLYYIENWSILFDFRILFLTFITLFKQKNAY